MLCEDLSLLSEREFGRKMREEKKKQKEKR